MSSDEFQDLQKFGTGIIQKPDKDKKNNDIELQEDKVKEIIISEIVISNFRKILLFLHKIFCRFSKLLIDKKNIFSKKIKDYLYFHNIKKYNKKLNRKKSISRCYKIVETKKEKKDKTIIIRRRVPIDNIIEKSLLPNDNIKGLYFLKVHSSENGSEIIEPVEHVGMKKSVWDFPLKKKKRIKISFNRKKKK